MLLTNFKPEDDYISINYNCKILDLHNDYEFVSIVQNDDDRVILLNFNKRNDDWVAEDSIENFSLKFTAVRQSWFRERDNDAFPEDAKVLSMIGFSTDDDYMDGVIAKTIEDMVLILIFENGCAIKVASQFAELIENVY